MSKLLKSAQNSLCIQSVDLRNANLFVGDDVDLSILDRNKTVTQSYRSANRVKITALADDKGKEEWDYRFVYSVGLRLIYSSDIEESSNDGFKPLIEITGTFEAKYYSKNELSEGEIDEFTKNSVGYHTWPYWREFVQSSCARIGLTPVFEVPVYFMPDNTHELCGK